MSVQKPSIPKGTRDFNAETLAKRYYIFDTIKKVFVKYGFQPIETPTMENLSTLTGKYGEEGDRLLFKILNSGDFLKEATQITDYKKLTFEISEKGLRYDLTVPFARYVVMHQNEISFPFKRFQIQPVWRGDSPQFGRYREFYQCDADVVGTDSLVCEAELIQIYDEVFANFGIPVTIKINNRKILQGLSEVIQATDKLIDITIAIDKLDKLSWEDVKKELIGKGIAEEACTKIQQFIALESNELEAFFENNEIGRKGVAELKEVLGLLKGIDLKNQVSIDYSLARGLSYYTGCILEVKAQNISIGSIGGGGRYDDLTGVFGLKGVSGVGISFGADRIYDVLEKLELFPDLSGNRTKVLIITFDQENIKYAMPVLRQLRDANINAELYPEPTKVKKQMEYANKRSIPYTILIGSEEMNTGLLTIKNMVTGKQEKLTLNEIIGEIV
ncbi:MAG: histidine--tRNA ligase [Thermoflexibacter sp.]|jgi:histidyl-tRNA synthetase|nr:histidine--tRNA ligase [Thermoflexibacter sp.]